jgi:hypothetical protein
MEDTMKTIITLIAAALLIGCVNGPDMITVTVKLASNTNNKSYSDAKIYNGSTFLTVIEQGRSEKVDVSKGSKLRATYTYYYVSSSGSVSDYKRDRTATFVKNDSWNLN